MVFDNIGGYHASEYGDIISCCRVLDNIGRYHASEYGEIISCCRVTVRKPHDAMHLPMLPSQSGHRLVDFIGIMML